MGAGWDNGNVVGQVFMQIASGGARTVEGMSTGATQTGITIIEFTGAEVDFSNLQADATGTAGDGAVTMGAYDATSALLTMYVANAGGVVTNPTGTTELSDANAATNLRMSVAYDLASPATGLSWTGTGTDTIVVGVEIKEAAGSSPQDITGALYTNPQSFPAAVVGRGAVDIAGALFTNIQTFFGATLVEGGGPQSIVGSLYTNPQTFPASTITTGSVTIAGSLYTNPQTFFSASIAHGTPGALGSGGPMVILRRRRR